MKDFTKGCARLLFAAALAIVVSIDLDAKEIEASFQFEPEFVGKAVCAGCHAKQTQQWQGSHHDHSMQVATAATVLGNFDDGEFKKDGIVSRFFRKDDRYWVHTDGPDGKLDDFEIKYTFGFYPLQQYLVELSRGRFQALSIAWDSRPETEGGQRWFHLYPDEIIGHEDELHWTKPSQNWNHMCAECHSTNLQKNYDPVSRNYSTSWSEINVSCEACHGPGSQHVIWAERKPGFEQIDSKTKGLIIMLDKNQEDARQFEAAAKSAYRSSQRNSDKEIQICARCHSRRAQLFGDYRYGLLMDTHQPALLQQTLYQTDGQIKEEVFEYGSFLQSKMYQAGVACSDCHEPHSLKLRAAGNEVCLQCHDRDKYDTRLHHFHEMGAPGAYCIDCHMPVKNYMVIDARRDHGFRVPRPDLSERLGTTNACTNCHSGKSASWAADKVKQWYGYDPRGYQNYADTLNALRSGKADAQDRVMSLLRDKSQPAIARATVAAELGNWLSPELIPLLTELLNDAEPLVRSAVLHALEPLSPEQRWAMAHKLLQDPVRTVRALAAASFAGVPVKHISPGELADFYKATSEYLSSLSFNADHAAGQVNKANFHASRSEFNEAEQGYREAMILDPNWVPAYVNLADLFRQTNHDDKGEVVLREGLARRPESAILLHSLGLLQIRKKNLAEALTFLKQAAELDPGNTHFSRVYALALQGASKKKEALFVIESALKLAPNDFLLNKLHAELMEE